MAGFFVGIGLDMPAIYFVSEFSRPSSGRSSCKLVHTQKRFLNIVYCVFFLKILNIQCKILHTQGFILEMNYRLGDSSPPPHQRNGFGKTAVFF